MAKYLNACADSANWWKGLFVVLIHFDVLLGIFLLVGVIPFSYYSALDRYGQEQIVNENNVTVWRFQENKEIGMSFIYTLVFLMEWVAIGLYCLPFYLVLWLKKYKQYEKTGFVHTICDDEEGLINPLYCILLWLGISPFFYVPATLFTGLFYFYNVDYPTITMIFVLGLMLTFIVYFLIGACCVLIEMWYLNFKKSLENQNQEQVEQT